MARLHILCPTQKKKIATSVECSIEHKAYLPNIIKHSYCPHCQHLHAWTPDEAFFNEICDAVPCESDFTRYKNQLGLVDQNARLDGSRHIALVGNYSGPMSDSLSEPFNCPNCGARYEVVRIEEPPRPTDREVTCLSCGAPLHGREGKFLLKYFLTGRSKRRAYTAAVAQASQKGRKL